MKKIVIMQLEDAQRLIREAVHIILNSIGEAMSIVVLGIDGHQMAGIRMDGARYDTIGLAEAKALTALRLGRTTQRLSESGVQAAALGPNACTLGGGVPLVYEGVCIGAIGVSGRPPEEDHAIAMQIAALLQDEAGATLCATDGFPLTMCVCVRRPEGVGGGGITQEATHRHCPNCQRLYEL